MSVGAVYDRAPFLESTKYARSQTAPTANAPLLGQARGGGDKSTKAQDFQLWSSDKTLATAPPHQGIHFTGFDIFPLL
jgi:hypothetical protein